MPQKFRFRLVFLAMLLFLMMACSEQDAAVTPTATGVNAASGTTEPEGTPQTTPTPLLGEIVASRTPVPTATPGPVERQVYQAVSRAGLANTEILGVSVVTWVDLGTFLLTVTLGFFLGTILISRVLPYVVRRTPTALDDEVLRVNGGDLRWLLVIIALNYGTQQLRILGPQAKMLLVDIYFTLGLALTLRMVLRLIRAVDRWYRGRLADSGREEELTAVITMLVRVSILVTWIVAIIILLSHFGVNVSAFAAALGLGGLAISLAARDTVADAIAGMIILIDRPFRLGDRIEIKAVDTWGDVVDIGLRTTRIRTRDNRLVIVPNSSIGANEVINYSYPDPTYRIQTHVGIGYGTNVEHARRILIEAVREVEGVLPDKPVDALYIEIGENAMIFRVRWWIETYVDTRRMFDRVHTAMQRELDAAGIQIWPYVGYDINLQMKRGMAEQMSQAFWSQQKPLSARTEDDGDGG